jgi:pimeloyl-ACP methyl ester carboxylesterase
MRFQTLLLLAFLPVAVRADGPGDNIVDKVRPVPPPGVAVPAGDREELQASVDALGKEIEALSTLFARNQAALDLLPDVQIYHNAVRYALTYNEFFNAREIPVARNLLKQGRERAKSLRDGKAPWTTATGLVVRGYVSKIDGSVQPYGLVVPKTYHADLPHRYRLDLWWHGRGETLSEVNFINGRQTSPGEFAPPNAFVLHPYGRYCCANKLAGEIDTIEAIAHVKKHYPIDDNRMVARGFSMGGAACWQFAVHYPGAWAAAAPGAGFSETPDFLKVFQKETVQPTWYEKKLWHMYDCTDYAINLFNLPTVAYSGENDNQKQAADMMAEAMKKEGLHLTHLIGPKMGHQYHLQSKVEINARIDSIVARGRDPLPPVVFFTTWTLRYNQSHWARIDQLAHHWDRAQVQAELRGGKVIVKTQNVTALSLVMPPGRCPLRNEHIQESLAAGGNAAVKENTTGVAGPIVELDGERLAAVPVQSDRSWSAHFRMDNGHWNKADSGEAGSLHKRHGLQGPIDDAFMDSFLMVRPTGQPQNDKVGKWADGEMKHAIDHWRKQFRGEARVKNDDAVTEADIANHNLVLWGDSKSNKVLAKIADKLPIHWTADGVNVGDKKYSGDHHVPVMIYPNPLNPKRYVVLNSGFTFREYDYLNNARQVPKLPDYAIVDISVPVSSRAPGGIVDAGFFGEKWELTDSKK